MVLKNLINTIFNDIKVLKLNYDETSQLFDEYKNKVEPKTTEEMQDDIFYWSIELDRKIGFMKMEMNHGRKISIIKNSYLIEKSIQYLRSHYKNLNNRNDFFESLEEYFKKDQFENIRTKFEELQRFRDLFVDKLFKNEDSIELETRFNRIYSKFPDARPKLLTSSVYEYSLDPNERSILIAFGMFNSLYNEITSNVNSWHQFMENINLDQNIGIRVFVDEFGNPKIQSIVLIQDLFPIFSENIKLGSFKSCFHRISLNQIFTKLNSEISNTEERDNCSNCNNKFIEEIGYLIISQNIDLAYSDDYYHSGNIRSIFWKYQKNVDSQSLNLKKKTKVEYDNGSMFIIDHNSLDHIGLSSMNELNENEFITNIIGVELKTKIISSNFEIDKNILSVIIEDYLPNLSLVITISPGKGFIHPSEPTSPIQLTGKEIKIGFNSQGLMSYDYQNQDMEVTLLQNDQIIDSKGVNVTSSPTSFKDYSQEISIINEEVPYFMNNKFKLEEYLSQFTNFEQYYLIKIIKNFEYFDLDTYYNKYSGQITRMESHRKQIEHSISFFLSSTDDSRFKSSDIILNNISSMFPLIKTLRHDTLEGNIDQAVETDKYTFIWIYLLDDLSGSCDTLLNRLDFLFEILKKLEKKYNTELKYRIDINLIYIYETAYEKIRKLSDKISIQVHGKIVNEREKINEDGIFVDAEERKTMVDILNKYGSKNYGLGYKDFGGSLLIKTDRVSNLVPSIFWNPTDRKPLFFRALPED